MLYPCCTLYKKGSQMGNLKVEVVLRPNKADKFGKIPIAYRFTKNRKSTYKFSGLRVFESEWNPFEKRFWEKRPSSAYFRGRQLSEPYDNPDYLVNYIKNIRIHELSKRYNNQINEDLKQIFDLKIKSEILNKTITASSFRLDIKNKDLGHLEGNFNTYWKKRIDYFINLESSTWRAYSDTFKIFIKFTNGKEILFSDIDVDFIDNLKAFLNRQRKKDGTSWSEDYKYKVLKTFRSVYNQAIKDQIFDPIKNPFIKRIPHPKNTRTKEKLTVEEIVRIKSLELDKGSILWHTRNCFLFGIYNGGMRIGDNLLLRWENVKENRIEYQMEKNNKSSNLPLSDLSIEILKYYKKYNTGPRSFIFPFLHGSETESNFLELNKKKESKIAYINTLLKEIAKKANINKNISTHVARHTYTGLVIVSGGHPSVLKNILKHASQNITDGYVGTLDTSEIDNTHLKALSKIS